MSHRQPDHTIHPLFVNRWSPRAFTGAPIRPDQLNALFEAARWAPSAYNAQPWRFLYALRNDAGWADFLDLLLPFNQRWAANASALVFVLSKRSYTAPGKDNPAPLASHAFDAGAAWASLALQAAHDGLAAHAMGGFDRQRSQALLEIPDDYELQAVVAIGHQAARETLPDDLQAREQPSPRVPLQRLAAAGRFSPDIL
ncbi:nitroreductase family protein [Pseudomonas sp. CR3202]|uniref:nitroreductase family protein n=1 Tax=Pseudomonas sp. CR3202 TaxID=3351532 RepID=UPI003BF2FF28